MDKSITEGNIMDSEDSPKRTKEFTKDNLRMAIEQAMAGLYSRMALCKKAFL